MSETILLTVKGSDEVEKWRGIVENIFGKQETDPVDVKCATEEEIAFDIPEGRIFPELRTISGNLYYGEMSIVKTLCRIAERRRNVSNDGGLRVQWDIGPDDISRDAAASSLIWPNRKTES